MKIHSWFEQAVHPPAKLGCNMLQQAALCCIQLDPKTTEAQGTRMSWCQSCCPVLCNAVRCHASSSTSTSLLHWPSGCASVFLSFGSHQLEQNSDRFVQGFASTCSSSSSQTLKFPTMHQQVDSSNASVASLMPRGRLLPQDPIQPTDEEKHHTVSLYHRACPI